MTLSAPLLVVVTGPPAAGKTTLARALARELGLPLIAKDDIKETLFDALGIGDRDWSRRLGAATFDVQFVVFERLLEAGVGVVAEGNFSNAGPFRTLPPARIAQVVCSAPPDVLLERFRNRSERHAGHLDGVTISELEPRLLAGEWEPLALDGDVIRVDTTVPESVRVDELAARIRGPG